MLGGRVVLFPHALRAGWNTQSSLSKSWDFEVVAQAFKLVSEHVRLCRIAFVYWFFEMMQDLVAAAKDASIQNMSVDLGIYI